MFSLTFRSEYQIGCCRAEQMGMVCNNTKKNVIQPNVTTKTCSILSLETRNNEDEKMSIHFELVNPRGIADQYDQRQLRAQFN